MALLCSLSTFANQRQQRHLVQNAAYALPVYAPLILAINCVNGLPTFLPTTSYTSSTVFLCISLLCAWNSWYEFVLKYFFCSALLQCSHSYINLPGCLPVLSTCLRKLSKVLQRNSQWGQWKGFSPVCVRMWRLRCPLMRALNSHSSHVNHLVGARWVRLCL